MVRVVLHYAAAAIIVVCMLGFALFGGIAYQFLDPDRPMGDKLTTWLTPSRRTGDFVGPGWRYQKLQWLMFPLMFLAAILFGLTNRT